MKDLFPEAKAPAPDLFPEAAKGMDLFPEASGAAPETEPEKPEIKDTEFQDHLAKVSGITPQDNMLQKFGKLFNTAMQYTVMGKAGRAGKQFTESTLEPASKALEAKEQSLYANPGIKSAAQILPVKAAQLGVGAAKLAIPTGPYEVMAGFMAPSAMGPAMAALEKQAALGSKAIFRTAPNASMQAIRSIMEVEDANLRNHLIKMAPVMLGGKPLANSLANEVDTTVAKIIASAGDQGPGLLRRGLDTMPDADLEAMLGKKNFKDLAETLKPKAKQINVYGVEERAPLDLDAVLTKFTAPQQKMILRNGIFDSMAAQPELKPVMSNLLRELNNPTALGELEKDILISKYVGNLQDTALNELRENGAAVAPSNLDEIEKALSLRAPRSYPLQRMAESFKDLGQRIESIFEFEPKLKKFPQTWFDFSQMQGYPVKASRESTALLASTLEPLSTKAEYDIFRKMVILQDFKEELEGGAKLINGLSISKVNKALAQQAGKAGPNILEAVERHHKMVQIIGEDLVKRGYLGEEQLRDKYFRHQVIRFLDENTPADVYAKEGVKAPFRTYALPRKGEGVNVDTDYISVMHKLITKVKVDNTVDDFIRVQADRMDVLKTLPDEARLQLFGEGGLPHPGMQYELGTKTYRAFRYLPRNMTIKPETTMEKIITDALESNLNATEIAEKFKPLEVAGNLRQIYLVPDEVHDSLVRFSQPYREGKYFDLIKHPVRFWKRLTLTTAGLPWQMANLVGGMEALFREGDFAAIANIPKAIKMIGFDDETKGILKKALDNQLMMSKSAVKPAQDDFLVKFLDSPERYKAMAMKPLDMYDRLSNMMQNGPKFAKYMADTARIQAGKPVQTKSFKPDIEGLLADQKAVRLAKLTVVDMSANSPAFNTFFKDAMFPFMSFFYHNAKGWGKYATRAPADLLTKFGGLYAGMQYWNYQVDPALERSLPEWQRYQPHILTGWKDEEGKHISISFESTGQLAAKWLAADKLMHRIGEVAVGDLSIQDATEMQLKDMLHAPLEQTLSMVNPLLNAMRGIATNTKKPAEGGGKIVPERLEGTWQGSQLQAKYLLDNLVTPLSKWIRTEAKLEAEPVNPLARFLRYGPLDVERAFGVHGTDMMQAERGLRFTRSQDATVLNNQNYANIEDAWVKSNVTNDYDHFDKSLAENEGKITLPAGKSISEYLKSPRVSLKILRERFKASRDPMERERLKQEIMDTQEIQSLRGVKEAPRSSKLFILEGATP